MAYAGVGLGLIRSQQLFWSSNLISGIVIYNRNNIYFYNLNLFLFLLCIFLYIVSILRAIKLIAYLEIKH